MEFKARPESSWKARDAWLCVAAIIVCDLVEIHGLRDAARNYDFWNWVHTLPGIYFTVVLQGGSLLGLAFYFARSKSGGVFLKQVGYKSGITLFGWGGAVVAVAIGILDHFGALRGWTAASRQASHLDDNFQGIEWMLYAAKSLSIVPFYEEALLRGFLYEAFRRSYGFFPSMVLVVCFTAYLHLHSVLASGYTTFCFALLWVLLCTVKERTGSLWNCLLCHVIFNAIGYELWVPVALVMVLILLLLMRTPRASGTS